MTVDEKKVLDEQKVINIKMVDIQNFIEDFPESVSLHEIYTFRIKNQKSYNSCSIMALTSLIEYLRQIDGKEFIPLSDNYIFYNCVQLVGNPNISGFKTCSVIKSILTKGACYQRRWRTIFDANIKPSNQIILESISNIKDTEIEIIDVDLNCIRYILGFCKRPIVANIKFTEGCKSIDNENDIDNEDDLIFNHSVLLVGYDDKKQTITYQNSYGEKWGNNGFSEISYDYIKYINSLYSMSESCIKSFFEINNEISFIEK